MEEKLIEFVRENEFLYNKRSCHYKNVYLRDKKFEDLSTKIGFPAKKLKDRWRTLKDKFYREIKTYKYPSGSGAASPKKKWKWMDHLMFLKEVDFANDNTSGNFPRYEENTYLTESNVTSPYSEGPSTSSFCERPSTSSFSESFLSDGDLGLDGVFEDSDKIVPPQKSKKKSKTIEELLKEAKQEMSEMVTLAKDAFHEQEPKKTMAQHFFEGLARQTDEANLSVQEFSRLQIKMLECFNSILYP